MYLHFIKYFLIFIILSFCGYIAEVVYCSILCKRFVNRGFLFGPVCPIYGVGGLLIIILLNKYNSDPLIVFLVGMLITSVIEYYTSYLLEKLFHNKWWDYSNRKDSINGRVCLKNSLLFGIGSLAIIYIAYPLINKLLGYLSNRMIIILGSILLIIFIIDIIFSSFIAYNLRHRIIIAEELKEEKLKMLPIILEKKYSDEIAKLKIVRNRLLKAFPNIASNQKNELDLIQKVQNKQQKKKK